MRAVLQRVSRASVRVDSRVIGEIEAGLVVLLGVAAGDTRENADQLVDKIVSMRIFANASGKFDLSLGDLGGGLLVVSQFTLLADTSGGRRPSFSKAARPDVAQELYAYFVERSRDRGVPTQTGEFGAHMELDLVNDGPVTIVLDTADL